MSIKVCVFWANVGPYHLARCRALAQHCELTLLEIAGGGGDHGWKVENNEESFNWVRLYEDRHYSSINKFDLWKRMNVTLNEINPDVLMVPSYSPYWSVFFLYWGLIHGKRRILMSCSNEFDFPRTWVKELPKKVFVQLCHAGLVGGKNSRAYMEKLGMPSHHVFEGYNCVDNSFFSQIASKVLSESDQWRKKYSLPEHYFFTPVRLVPKKNLTTLVEAYSIYIKKVHTPWPLIICGDGPEKNKINDLIIKHNLQNMILLRPFQQVDDLARHYALGSGLVLPSYEEQWGLVVNEAMASGLPVLVSKLAGCVDDLVIDSVTGRSFNPSSREEIADAMAWLSSLPAKEWKKLSEQAQKRIGFFSPERFAKSAMSGVQV